MTEAGGPVVRRRIRVTGTVQGVGFRPFVYREAVGLGLHGHVLNDSAGVEVEVEGPADRVAELCRILEHEPPPLARVQTVDAVDLEPTGEDAGFVIVASVDQGRPDVPVSVDTATCADCLAEVDDPADRRYRYPFTNCTNCGPRYTIVRSVPYDRPATTMAGFVMCADCQREYDDPADRRFHAQPNACPVCGPRLAYLDLDGRTTATGDEALRAAVDDLRLGRTVAVKGIGGFHLAVDATDADAVAVLRKRKARDDKPFAVMVPDLDGARALCDLGPDAERALGSHLRPIVLAPRVAGSDLAPGVAPGLPEVGLMLAYTPLHHLLLAGVDRPLVMTSGNRSDEPIVHTDADAVARLAPLVDAVLTHDRGIHIRCDDSVVRSTKRRVQSVRRSRGYAPEPLPLAAPAARQVLAVGAELKSTVSVAKGSSVVTSHHLGDLEHPAAYASFLQAVDHLCDLYGVRPEVVAHDLHPEYLSTKFATDLDLPAAVVQHHHAHIASCLAEHGETGAVVGLAFDGLGMGTDGVLWGGEVLVADLAGFDRAGHLIAVAMPGGAAAIREPWRMALAWVAAAAGREVAERVGTRFDERARAVLDLAASGRSPQTTSMGRLFDAVSALVGVRSKVTYEGQAAIELEALARTVDRTDAPVYEVPVTEGDGGGLLLDPRPLVAEIVADMEAGRPAAEVAAGFHEGVGAAAVEIASRIARARGLDTVALSGGVFQNARLTEIVEEQLADQGFRVLVHTHVPPNDGGISVGQAAVAAWPGAQTSVLSVGKPLIEPLAPLI